MIRFLLDTDHISLQERGHPPLLAHIRSLPAVALGVSIVTVEEVLRGRLAMLGRRLPAAERVHAYRKLWEAIQFFGAARAFARVGLHALVRRSS